jgi:hypothetical protein
LLDDRDGLDFLIFDLEFLIWTNTTLSFNPTFLSQVIIRKPISDGRTDDTNYQSPFQEALGNNQDRLCHRAINFNFYNQDKFEAMF